LVAAGSLAVTAISLLANFVDLGSAFRSPPPCVVRATTTSDIVSRLYARADFNAAASDMVMNFQFQELFYEWTMTLSSENLDRGLALTISHMRPDDRIAITPADHKSSDLVPMWLSGFPEPARSPDYYRRTISFDRVAAGESGVVLSVRRPLSSGTPIVPGDLIRIDEVSAGACKTILSPPDVIQDAPRLDARARLLPKAVRPNGTELPAGRDPGDLRPKDTQATIEARCASDSCDTLMMRNLEARLGQPLHAYHDELNDTQCATFAAALEDILGCVDGPYCLVSIEEPPSARCEFGMCGEMLELTSDQRARLRLLFGNSPDE
jgi:hypothetical protein